MAKTRAQKEQMVANLTDTFSHSKSAVFAEFSGLTMKDLEGLRGQARKEQVGVSVAKKSLTDIAAKQVGWTGVNVTSIPNSLLTMLGFEDEVAPARLVAEFAKSHEGVRIVGGVLEGTFQAGDRMVALSKVPGRQQLYAQLVGSLNAPISGYVNVLAGNLRGLVTALTQIQQQKV